MDDAELARLEALEREASVADPQYDAYVHEKFHHAMRSAAPELLAEVRRLRQLCREAAERLSVYESKTNYPESERLLDRLRAAGGET